MNQNSLTKLSKVILTTLSIAFTTSLFSPTLGQLSEELNNNIVNENIEVVSQAALQDFSQRTGIEISNPDIDILIDYQEWSNSCLELKEAGEECFDIITPGWRVVVDKAEERFVYHTNNNGSIVKLKKFN